MEGVTPLPAGVNGVSVPICVRCPVPGYSDKARKAGIQATAVLVLAISADGHVARIGIIKDPGFGLTDQAIETVEDWEFKPALGKDGKPVPAKVPVEVTFRTTRN